MLARKSLPSLALPQIAQSRLSVRPIQWGPLPRQRMMNPGESEVFVALLRSVGARRVIEFGVHLGIRAKLALMNVLTLQHYIGIDVPAGFVTACAVQRREVPDRPGKYALDDRRFELRVTPRGSFDLEPGGIGSVDVAFIDGDHSRRGVEHDSALACEIVRAGGLIVWHDYHAIGTVEVRPVLEQLASAGRRIEHVENTWIAFERR